MTIETLRRLARDAEQHHRYEDALNLYRLALADAEESGRASTVPPLQVRVGELLLTLGLPAAAFPHFERAGHAYARRGMGPEVSAIRERLLMAAPRERDGLRVLLAWAGTMLTHGHSATATAILEVSIRRRGEDATAALRAAARSDPALTALVEESIRKAAGPGSPPLAVAESLPTPIEESAADRPAGKRERFSPARRPGSAASRPQAEDAGGVRKADPVREPFFRRAPRRRWLPFLEFLGWMAGAAALVFLLLRLGAF